MPISMKPRETVRLKDRGGGSSAIGTHAPSFTIWPLLATPLGLSKTQLSWAKAPYLGLQGLMP